MKYNTWNIFKLSAFTLAEVLITLGIIGVIAALTIPSLVSKYRGDVVVTRLKKFYSNINQAIERSELDNGDKKDWDAIGSGQDALNWYNKYLKNYLVTLNVKVDDNNQVVLVYFADGSMLWLSKYALAFYPKASDYTGVNIDKNESGRKYFNFLFDPNIDNSSPYYKYYYNKGVEPYKYSWDGTREGLLNNANYGCQKNVPTNGRALCTALIQYDGWKIPSDYPLNF